MLKKIEHIAAHKIHNKFNFFTGHAHITDFNIATRLQPDGLACSMSGTLPYMAPEVIQCALDEISEYLYKS